VLIPRHWTRADGAATDPNGKPYRFQLWGWSEESVADALRMARDRLADVVARIAHGEPSGAYLYEKQPLREEIIRQLGDAGSESEAVVTRNRYGARVLNTAQVPFIDVDAPQVGALARLFGRFRHGAQPDPTLERIREACRRTIRHAFRIYRTKAGYRVLATDLFLDPRCEKTREFLAGFAADPFFIKLCGLQGSFRARLTPKPWRCGCSLPPGRYPRNDPSLRSRFDAWPASYEAASTRFASCRFVESIGSGRPSYRSRAVVDEHDTVTQALSDLPPA